MKNQLHYTAKHVQIAEKMMNEKRHPADVYCQFRAVEGGAKKIISKLFYEAMRRELATRISKLSVKENLDDESAETLDSIQKQAADCHIKPLLKLFKKVEGIEKLFMSFILFQTDFFELLLQNSPLAI